MSFQNRRVMVGPRDWDNVLATDYGVNFLDLSPQVAAASASSPYGLSGWGHVTTALTTTANGTGNFNSSANFDPTFLNMGAAADAFVTPSMFGGYDQFQRVGDVLLYLPTTIVVDVYAQFNTASANETTSFFGLCAPAVTDMAAAGGGGGIRSGGTASTFFLTSDNGSDAGAAIDTSWHRWRIVYGSTNTEWFDDIATPGTLASRGTITTEINIWPLSFKALVGATNRIRISWFHISYV